MKKTDAKIFAEQLAVYQARIEPRLKQIAQKLLDDTRRQYGDEPAEIVRTYNQVLLRGGKRIRGALAICAYEMFGGKDSELIEQAGAGLEMLNTYILIADDIQDRSELRRGGPTAHILLSNYHQAHKYRGDAEHFGTALSINSFLFGLHESINVFTNLPVNSDLRLRVIELINQGFITTMHGQSLDILGEYKPTISEQEVHNIMAWKTAYYTFINPLQLGALLAGASKKDMHALEQFGLHAGKLFQLADDITGIFDTKQQLGKSPKDDIKEGKRNFLIVKTLELAIPPDASYLQSKLGKQSLTDEEFIKCKNIIKVSGALQAARQIATNELTQAQEYLKSVSLIRQHFLENLLQKINKDVNLAII